MRGVASICWRFRASTTNVYDQSQIEPSPATREEAVRVCIQHAKGAHIEYVHDAEF
jgi:hypothetical protein